MGRSSRASLGDDDAGDATERLLPRDARRDDDDAFTHEELLHSIGSFSAVVPPVVLTMLLARWASVRMWVCTNVWRIDLYLCGDPASRRSTSWTPRRRTRWPSALFW